MYKRPSGHLYWKGFRRDIFLMTRATQKDQASTSLKTNCLSIKPELKGFHLQRYVLALALRRW